MPGRALVSVSDKTNLVELCSCLHRLGYEILSTSGTAAYLKEVCPITDVSTYTAFPEILSGRVKSLHPKIYAGILGRPHHHQDKQELDTHSIQQIDLVVVNFYNFASYKNTQQHPHSEEDFLDSADHMDIGGPCMLRAAAKNWQYVTALCDPDDYRWFMDILNHRVLSLNERRSLAAKAFDHCYHYDKLIAEYLHLTPTQNLSQTALLSTYLNSLQSSGLKPSQYTPLRYGENHHQQGYFYPHLIDKHAKLVKLQGKELSYNNFLDMDSAIHILREYPSESACVIIKHMVACGLSTGKERCAKDLFECALQADSRSAFGGTIGFSCTVDKASAEQMIQGFFEIILAPDFDQDALEVLSTKPQLSLIKVALKHPMANTAKDPSFEVRSLWSGLLVQNVAKPISGDNKMGQVVSKREPSAAQWQDLLFAFKLVKHQRSNSIVIAQEGCLLSHGSGHTSRIDACEFALNRLQPPLNRAVLASDGFFPFSDVVEQAAQYGIRAIIAPRGSKNDQASIDAANNHDLALVFTDNRYFKH
ncbi:MAG: bifunctional phosphoribosylaminoimidazolecarboxamide formyltransferase/IMP cyclohydrolase [Proteobacteria bacterium]|nr:bifunctional phosphoribosylaminoimidazolecarboxamide formyltransferase/IMP cyclohydrolase [Pseudomonadota bacterium]